jgi:hypothetical protein
MHAVQAPNKGSKACDCIGSLQRENDTGYKALDAPANIADMPISAAIGMVIPASRKYLKLSIPIIEPRRPRQ